MRICIKFISENQKGISLGLFVVAVSLAAVGLAFINIANHSVSLQGYSEKWTKTLAQIESVKIEVKESKKYPKIQYRFSVDGQSFLGTRIFFSEGPYEKVEEINKGVIIETFPPQGTEKQLTSLIAGEQIEIFYNPHNPKESVIVRHALGEMKMFMLLGMFALISGLFLVAKSLLDQNID